MSSTYPRRRHGAARRDDEPLFHVYPPVKLLANGDVGLHAAAWGGPVAWCPIPAARAWMVGHELVRLAEAQLLEKERRRRQRESPGQVGPARAAAELGAPAIRPGAPVESRR
jgi:hypothetical protein